MNQGEELTGDLESYVRGLPAKPATTVRFFDRRDWYCVFEEDASFLALEVRKTEEALKVSKTGLKYANVSQPQFQTEVREMLLLRQYRVEMHSKASGGWKQQYTCSPGNTGPLEDILYSSRDNLDSRGLIAISHSDSRFGIAFIDTICRTIKVSFFTDDQNLSSLECILVQLAPKEAVVPNKTQLLQEITAKLEINQVTVTAVPAKDFLAKKEDAVPVLEHLLLRGTSTGQVTGILSSIPDQERVLVEGSLIAATKYLQLMAESGCQYEFSVMAMSQFVKLDAAAVSALDLFPTRKGSRMGMSKDKRSVFGLLNKCRTLPGQRLLSQWIRQPLVDILKINERLTLVDHFVLYPERRVIINEQRLRGVPDLVRFSRKLQQRKVQLSECYSLFRLIKSLPSLPDDIGCDDNPYIRIAFGETIEALLQQLDGETKFTGVFMKVLDFDHLRDKREYRVNPSVSAELKASGQKLAELDRQAADHYRSALRDLGLEEKHLKFATDDEKGYFFSVTNRNEKHLRNRTKYRILPSGKKDGIKFTTDDLNFLSDEYVEQKAEFVEIESQILKDYRDIFAAYAVLVRQVSDVLAHLDVIVALAVAAASAPTPYVRPEMMRKGCGVLSLRKLRHPCIEALGANFIANDVELAQQTQKFKLITGPNMGGKSTYIRSVAIAILMAQMGSYVPADEAKISIVDGIYTRIGASDKQLQGYSTFMNEMVETAAILRSATEHSFIVIDELGRGTSTFDGYGLAYAISKHIARELRSYCLFATHYAELTDLAKEEPSIGNLHVAVSEADASGTGILMLYEVRSGISTQSYGINVAKAAAFPADLISLAQEKLEEMEDALTAEQQVLLERILATDLDSPEQVRRLLDGLKK